MMCQHQCPPVQGYVVTFISSWFMTMMTTIVIQKKDFCLNKRGTKSMLILTARLGYGNFHVKYFVFRNACTVPSIIVKSLFITQSERKWEWNAILKKMYIRNEFWAGLNIYVCSFKTPTIADCHNIYSRSQWIFWMAAWAEYSFKRQCIPTEPLKVDYR